MARVFTLRKKASNFYYISLYYYLLPFPPPSFATALGLLSSVQFSSGTVMTVTVAGVALVVTEAVLVSQCQLQATAVLLCIIVALRCSYLGE